MLPGNQKFSSLLLITLLVILSGLYFFSSNSTLNHLLTLKHKEQALQSETWQLVQDIHSLQGQILALKNNPDLREKLIREELHYVKPDEKVIWVQPGSGDRGQGTDNRGEGTGNR